MRVQLYYIVSIVVSHNEYAEEEHLIRILILDVDFALFNKLGLALGCLLGVSGYVLF